MKIKLTPYAKLLIMKKYYPKQESIRGVSKRQSKGKTNWVF